MRFVDLLRATVFLLAVEATALAIAAITAALNEDSNHLVIVAAAWWLSAIVIGLWLGRRSAEQAPVRQLLAAAKTATSLPSSSPARLTVMRLWPFGAFAVASVALAPLLATVPACGAGMAILNALAWRNREALVSAVEDRDGVTFYVEETGWLSPIKLVRTPGLRRDLLRDRHGAGAR